MKNILYSVILLLLSITLCKAQNKFGNTFAVGIGGYNIKYTAPNIYEHDTLIVNPGMFFLGGGSCISDSNGDLLILSNGMNLFNKSGTYIDGGDTLSPKLWYNLNQGTATYPQGSLILPMANKKYYFMNVSMSDTQFAKAMNAPDWTYPTDVLMYHVVDMSMNNGAGKVTERMKYLIQGTDLFPSAMMACRHSNGKDWWLLKQAGDSINGNRIFKFLFTQDSVYNMGVQTFGAFIDKSWNFSTYTFSPDGTKLAARLNSTTDGKIYLADFDRCTGILSNFSTINIMPIPPLRNDSINLSVCFSPNGQFLYVSRARHIMQYNLQNGNQYKVYGLDTTEQAFAGYSKLNLCADGKIYISTLQGISNQMSTIDNPDMEGAGCNFCRKCLRSQKVIGGTFHYVSDMPNYELGASGQPCYPLGYEEVQQHHNKIKLYPNPFNEQLTIEYELPKGETGKIGLYTLLGVTIYEIELSSTTNKVSVQIPNLPMGVYLYKYSINDKVVEFGKLIKE